MIQQFTSGYLSKQNENTNFIYTHLHVHCSVIYSGQIWKQTKCPSMDRWVKEMWYIYAHSGISYNHKKNKILPFATIWIDLEGIMLSEIKSEEDKYKNISLTCEILKKIIFLNS